MAVAKKIIREKVRTDYMKKVGDFLAEMGEEVLVVGSNEFAIPVVREDGEEDYVVLTFKMPTGSRDGDGYDGYAMRDDYAFKCEEKRKKDEQKRIEKEKKMARDKKKREEKKGEKKNEG